MLQSLQAEGFRGTVYLHSFTVEADGLCQSQPSPHLWDFLSEGSPPGIQSLASCSTQASDLKMSQFRVKSYPYWQFLLSEKGLTLIVNCGGLNINDPPKGL